LIDQETTMEVRSLGDILSETFTIYGRNLKQLVRLTAIVQIPANLIWLLPINDVGTYVVLNAAIVLGMQLVFGAIIVAVGQQYVSAKIDVAACYAKVVERAVSMFILASILVALVALLGIVVGGIEVPAVGLPILAVMAVYSFYLAIATPAVMVERYKWIGALQRSFALARRNEWRILGRLLVFSLVAIGLSIVVSAPFWLMTEAASLDETAMLNRAVVTIGNIVVVVLAAPVLHIAATLLYYDLRVRKEGYDIAALSQEMELAAS
jgi:hypothetical protein